MKKIIISLLMILVVISICSCTTNKTIDDELIENSTGILETWFFDENQTFSVVEDNQNEYRVDINGKKLTIKIENDNNLENTKSNVNVCDEEVTKIVKASKEIVVDYINESNILNEKNELVEYINNIPVQMADFSTDEAVEYDSELNSIFINNQNRNNISEWEIIHELFSALSEKTNGGKENQRYHNSLFNEVLIDTIIDRMQLKTELEGDSKYYSEFLWIYWYLGCVGIDGIEAYFYGYGEILECIPEAELDIFVELLEDTSHNEDAVIILSNCINKWGLEK